MMHVDHDFNSYCVICKLSHRNDLVNLDMNKFINRNIHLNG